ncbi:CvpA family protein [Halobacillus sp. ACCC02827]|uniref:CvpA family protein n=1 Tax=Bacillaceae TaxID=186817 RepID=UPI0003FB2036|nr:MULTISPECIES: CvpA family protein [Bacillaceae]QHT47363.1 CvpA family protein [Bacillus sp. SB49]WJE14586.1 CvpA family protein [Halobacillus sp. ACCC02827]
MIDLLILFLLLIGVITGLKRGFILQLFHLIGFVVAFVVAVIYYDDLAPKLTLWVPYPELPADSSWAVFLNDLPLEQAFYNAIAFAILFFGAKIILHIIASMLDFVSELPILSSINTLLGGILGFVENYVILFIVLYIAALVPAAGVQNALDSSILGQLIIEHTPVFSDQLKTLWIDRVAG